MAAWLALSRRTASNPPKEDWEWEPNMLRARRTYLTRRGGRGFCLYLDDLLKAKRLAIEESDQFTTEEPTCGFFGGGARVKITDRYRSDVVMFHMTGSTVEFWTSTRSLEEETRPPRPSPPEPR